MGLDQYLMAKVRIGGEYKHNGITGSINIYQQGAQYNSETKDYDLHGDKRPLLELDDMSQVSEIEFAAGYWRKANSIHAWFVENVQGGVDECQLSYVGRNQLKELLALCKHTKSIVMSSPKTTKSVCAGWKNGKDYYEDIEIHDVNEDLLPLKTTSGFFFGSTEYGEWFIQDMDDTIRIIEKLFANPIFEEATFYYQASW